MLLFFFFFGVCVFFCTLCRALVYTRGLRLISISLPLLLLGSKSQELGERVGGRRELKPYALMLHCQILNNTALRWVVERAILMFHQLWREANDKKSINKKY